MGKTSVVSNEYLALHEQFVKLQEQWKNQLNENNLTVTFDKAANEAGVPMVAMTTFHLDFSLLLQWVDEAKAALVAYQPELKEQLDRISELLDEETANAWFEAAMAFNQPYFTQFAEENNLDEWLPPYFSEMVFRPYLQLLSDQSQKNISHSAPGCGCPVCGEPVRLGQLEGQGKKVLHCPRCGTNWPERKLSCSHCGNEDYEKMKYLTIEGSGSEQIHVCEECKGYTKIIDTRQFINKPSPALLDLKTIHLDYIAQENGYQVMGARKDKS
jgi:FdhE protein